MRQQPETIGDVILLYVQQQHGTQANAAIAWHCSTTMLSEVIRGTRRPTERMLAAIGYRHVEAWLPQSVALPASALPMSADGVSVSSEDQGETNANDCGSGDDTGRRVALVARAMESDSGLGQVLGWNPADLVRLDGTTPEVASADGVAVPRLPQQWEALIEEAVDAFAEGATLGDRLPNAMAALRDALASGVEGKTNG